tara:strand:+ start:1491 stop:3644 length:2154 start_codon:yes stop_codon:yes gene_type:complete
MCAFLQGESIYLNIDQEYLKYLKAHKTSIVVVLFKTYKHHTMASLVNNPALQCPITQLIMIDPVKAPDGHTYERSAIIRALQQNGRSPLTRQVMLVEQLVPDYTLKSLIESLNSAGQSAAKFERIPDQISAKIRSKNGMTQLTFMSPDGEAGPQDICFVVDTSGSMQTEVRASTGEADGFSILDVTKHGILACVCGLREQDRASIVAYSSRARVVVPLRRMDAAGKAQLKVALAGLEPEQSTNIWAGLDLGIQQLSDGGTVFLLTDGQPNDRPPRGELAMLQRTLDGRDDIVVNTYGFGYDLDSKLLLDLSNATQGSYSFIPDIGLVGTVFIHAMANLRTSVDRKLVVRVETEGTVSSPFVNMGWGYQLPVGRITKGQARDIFIECDKPVSVTVEGIAIETSQEAPGVTDRILTALGVFRCHDLARSDTQRANTHLNEMLANVTAPLLQEDLNGQVREAIQPTAYRRWGRHYLPSLALAHWTQQCNNFLDKGIQGYGGPTFQNARDELDTAFNELPAPQPTHRRAVVHRMRSQGRQVSAAPARMSSYNVSSAGICFAGACRVKMADGSLKACDEIRKGDRVQTSKGEASVQCVAKTICGTSIASLVKIGRLMVTPWHPLNIENEWVFPVNIAPVQDYPCQAVFSFLLESGFQDMVIEDIACISLAHGILDNPVTNHSFFGTENVVKAMAKLPGWSDGVVEIHGVERDTETNLVCGFY